MSPALFHFVCLCPPLTATAKRISLWNSAQTGVPALPLHRTGLRPACGPSPVSSIYSCFSRKAWGKSFEPSPVCPR